MKVIQYLLMAAGLLLPSVALHAAGAGDPAHMQKMVDSIMAKVEQRAEHKGSRVKSMADAMKLAVVQELIKQSGISNPEVYNSVKSFEDALLVAAEYDHGAIAKQLFVHNKTLNVNFRATCEGKTALMIAAELGHVNFVQFLISQNADPNICDNEGESPLLHVLYKSDDVDEGEAIALLLLKHNANANISSNEGLHPAIFAQEIRNRKLRQLIAQADVNYQDPESGDTALIKAARAGKAEIVKDLLELNADVNRTNKAGHNALAVAKENVKPLLSAKPKAEAKAFVGGAGMLPATAKPFVSRDKEGSEGDSDGEGDEPRVQGAIQAEVLALCQKVGVTDLKEYNQVGSIEEALFAAAENGHLDLFKALFTAHPDIDVNAQDDNGETLVMVSAKAGALEVLRYLLTEKKANVNLQNDNGATAILLVLINSDIDENIDYLPIIELLLQFNANPSISDDEGNHPLLYQVGSTLIKNADIDYDNGNGSALMKAVKHNDALIEGLVQAGATITDEIMEVAKETISIEGFKYLEKLKKGVKDKKTDQKIEQMGPGTPIVKYPNFTDLSIGEKNKYLVEYVKSGDVNGVIQVLAAGANANIKPDGKTLIMLASAYKTEAHKRIIEILLKLKKNQKTLKDESKSQKIQSAKNPPIPNFGKPMDPKADSSAKSQVQKEKNKKKKAKQGAQRRAAKQAEKDKEAKEKAALELEDRLKKAAEARASLDKQKALEHDAWLAQERARRAWESFSTTEKEVNADKVRLLRSLKTEVRRQAQVKKAASEDTELHLKDIVQEAENESELAKLKDELFKDARAIKAEQEKDKAKRDIQSVISHCAWQAVDQVERRKQDEADSRKREIHQVIAHCATAAVEQSEQRKQKEAKPKTYQEYFEQALKEKMNGQSSETVDMQALKQQILKQWLFSAIEKGNKDLVLFCLGNGIDINCKDFDHYASTPIIMACSTGQLAIAKLLVQNKADLLIVNGVGETAAICAAQYAARTGDAGVLEWLRSLNVIDMNAQDFSRKTAFDYLMSKFTVAKKDAQTQTE